MDALEERYAVGDRLGGGAAGDVFRGVERSSGEAVAIKRFRRSGGTALALREIAALLATSHPHLLRCRDVLYLGAGECVLVTDLVPGGDLRAWMDARGAIPAVDALRLAAQLVDALGALHEAGLVHGDLKPENVLVEERPGELPFLRLGDLGSVRLVGPDAALAPGTPAYLAPERAAGRSGPGADLYALGVVLHELLAGRRPFEGDPAQLRRLHARAAPDLSPISPPAVQDLVRRLLEKDPSHRHASAPEVARAVAAILANLEAGAPRRPRVTSTGTTRVPFRTGPGWKRAAWDLPALAERWFLLHTEGRAHVAIELRGTLELWDAFTGKPTGVVIPQVGTAIGVSAPGELLFATSSRLCHYHAGTGHEETLAKDVTRVLSAHLDHATGRLLWVGADRAWCQEPDGSRRSWPLSHFGWGSVARPLPGGGIAFAAGPHRPAWVRVGAGGLPAGETALPGPLLDLSAGPAPFLGVVVGGGRADREVVRVGEDGSVDPVALPAGFAVEAFAFAGRALWLLDAGGTLLEIPPSGAPVARGDAGPRSRGLAVTADGRFLGVVEDSSGAVRLTLYETVPPSP